MLCALPAAEAWRGSMVRVGSKKGSPEWMLEAVANLTTLMEM